MLAILFWLEGVCNLFITKTKEEEQVQLLYYGFRTFPIDQLVLLVFRIEYAPSLKHMAMLVAPPLQLAAESRTHRGMRTNKKVKREERENKKPEQREGTFFYFISML